MTYKIAVVGATGAVGRQVLQILAERNFPVGCIVALASDQSKGKQVSFGEDRVLDIEPLSAYDFNGTHITFFAAGGKISRQYVPLAMKAGSYVIDKSSVFRMQKDVPLIVPEVNGPLLHDANVRLIANPNCVATPLGLALKALETVSPLKRIVVSTYQSVSGKGRRAMDELFRQTKAIMVGNPVISEEFPKQIAFNLIPQIDDFYEDGSTGEETKVIQETQKILGLPNLPIAITCVRVPVFIGHSMAVNVTFEGPVTLPLVRQAFKKMPGVMVMDNPEQGIYATPLDAAEDDNVLISRLRKDASVPHGLSFWLVSDNLRKGAALNAVQIAETLLPLLKKRIPITID